MPYRVYFGFIREFLLGSTVRTEVLSISVFYFELNLDIDRFVNDKNLCNCIIIKCWTALGIIDFLMHIWSNVKKLQLLLNFILLFLVFFKRN